MKKFIADLFKGAGNGAWDLARVTGGWAILSYSFLPIGQFIRNGEIPDYAAVGVGFAAVMGGAGALIFAKDTARTNAVSQVTKDAKPEPAAPTTVEGDLKAEHIETVEVKGK